MPKIMQTEESKLIEAIRDVLMAADAVRCDIESHYPRDAEPDELLGQIGQQIWIRKCPLR